MNAHEQALRDYARLFETVSPAVLNEIDRWFAPDARFKDPFNDVRGHDAIRRVFQRMFETCHDIRFTVSERLLEGDTGFLVWRMEFRPNVKGYRNRTWHVEGVSHIRFAADGRVAEHVDYWDSGEYFYRRLPLLGTLIRLIRKRVG